MPVENNVHPLGPVATDTPLLASMARQRFLKDSLEAMRKTDSALAPVDYRQVMMQPYLQQPQKQIVPSLFSGHSLTDGGGPRPAGNESLPPWTHGIILLILILIALLNRRYITRMKTLFDAFILNRFISQLTREENIYFNRVNSLLSLHYLIAVSLFSTLASSHLGIRFPYDPPPFLLFLLFMAALVMVFSLKILVVKVAGSIFNLQKAANEYAFSILLYNQMAALFLIPILICMTYLEIMNPIYFAWTGAGLLVFFYLFRLFRVVTGGLASPSVSMYYLFLYLCTLEFLPVAISIKLVMP